MVVHLDSRVYVRVSNTCTSRSLGLSILTAQTSIMFYVNILVREFLRATNTISVGELMLSRVSAIQLYLLSVCTARSDDILNMNIDDILSLKPVGSLDVHAYKQLSCFTFSSWETTQPWTLRPRPTLPLLQFLSLHWISFRWTTGRMFWSRWESDWRW